MDFLLVHGALGTDVQTANVALELQRQGHRVFNVVLPGHGHQALSCRFHPFDFADYLLSFADKHNVAAARVFGYSMGGYVAVIAGLSRPERFSKIVTLGTKWHWSPEIANGEIQMLQPETIAEKVPRFAAQLAALHGEEGWKILLHRTSELMTELGRTNPLRPEVLRTLKIPVTILLGDSDKMVTREESERAARSIPQGQFRLLPDTKHPIESANPEIICRYLTA